MKRAIASVLDVREGEWLPLLLLLAHSFFAKFAVLFFEAPANTLYLSSFEADKLPYVYIVTALLSTLIGVLYTRLEAHVPATTLLRITLIGMAISIAGFYVGTLVSESRWLAFGMMAWKEVLWILSDFEFWAVAVALFNVRQGKRLFGLVTAGGIWATILGGFLTPAVVPFVGARGLFLLSAASTMSSALLLSIISRRFPAAFASTTEDSAEPDEASPSARTSLLRDPYMRLFVLLSILSVAMFYFLEFLFYQAVEPRFPDESSRASFFGIFFGVMGLLQLVFSSFLSGRLMARFGLAFGLLFLPFVGMVGSASMLTFSALGLGAAFFWIVVSTKLADETLRGSLEDPTFRLLYQPITPASRRLRAQVVRESVIDPISFGITGVALILLTSILTLDSSQMIWVLILLFAGYALVGLLLRRSYTRTLTQAMLARALGGSGPAGLRAGTGSSPPLLDREHLQILQKGIASADPAEVIYSLQLLEEQDPPGAEQALISALDSANDRIQSYALDRVESLRLSAASGKVVELIERGVSAQTRGGALRVYGAVADDGAFEKAYAYIEAPELEVRRGALIGLLRHGGIDGILAAGLAWNELVSSPLADNRIFAAEILGEVGITSFYRPLQELLADPDADVRAAALLAAERLRHLALVPAILANLRRPDVRSRAFSALVANGPPIIPLLGRSLADATLSPAVRKLILLACARIGDDKAIRILESRFAEADHVEMPLVASALESIDYQAPVGQRPLVQKRILSEVQGAAWIISASLDLEPVDDASLQEALAIELHEYRRRLLLLVSLLIPGEAFDRVRLDLLRGNVAKRATALEVLDNLTEHALRRQVLPLLDELPNAERLKRLQELAPQTRRTPAERLAEIPARPNVSEWSVGCALRLIGRQRMRDLTPVAAAALQHPSWFVRETAVWAVWMLEPPALADLLAPLSADADPDVAGWARRCLHPTPVEPDEEPAMLTIEKVIILKSVPIFAEIPEHLLVELASMAHEVSFEANARIITQGDMGDDAFVIVYGRVKVHEGDRMLRILGVREVFGDLAALDPGPRSASVTALEPTTLFRINDRILQELIAEHPEVASALIRVLCRRLRSVGAQGVESRPSDEEQNAATLPVSA